MTDPIRIGKFPVIRRLGSGAMGEVFLCLQPELDRHVAIKVMNGGSSEWPRFQREACSAAKLIHPYVIRIYDVGLDYERPYIVMEYVDGQALSDLIGSNYLTLPVILRLLYHVTEALEVAHRHSLIHRDLKPSNILIDSQGQPRIVDFGLAKSLLNDPGLSGSRDLIGTPRYMAPEQILGDNSELDQRVDIFALGVVMYEMLAGRPPFDGPNVVQIMRQVTDDDPDDLVSINPSIPPAVAQIAQKAMSKAPEDRYQTAAEMGAALRAVLLSGTISTSDDLKANEYLTSFVPTSSITSRKPSLVPWRYQSVVAFGAMAALVLVAFSIGWWKTPRDVVPAQVSRLDHDLFEAQKASLCKEAAQVLRGDLRLAQTSSLRDVLQDLIAEATSLLKRDPSDDELRLVRARLLRRGGECLAADTECRTILEHQPQWIAACAERLLARTQLWGLYLGSWEEPLLRYPLNALLAEDIASLRNSESPILIYLADLADHLAGKPVEDLMTLVSSMPHAATDPQSQLLVSDITALQVELLFRQALRASSTVMATRDAGQSETLLDAAQQRLRLGVATDPLHLPLLFLHAASFARRTDFASRDDRDAWIEKTVPQFDAAMEQLRRVTLRQGCDTPIARAVLLSNRFGSCAASEQQLLDALSCRPTISQLHAVRVWFLLSSPTTGSHTSDSLKRLIDELNANGAAEAADVFTPSFVEAVINAGLGRFMEASRQLKVCRQKLTRTEGWLALEEVYQRWLDSSDENYTAFLYASLPIVGSLQVGPEVAIQLHTELLNRLADAEIVANDRIEESVVKKYRAGTHFSLAQVYAKQKDRYEVLNHLRESLDQQSSEITPEICRQHSAFKEWNHDEGFENLYRDYLTRQLSRLTSNASKRKSEDLKRGKPATDAPAKQ